MSIIQSESRQSPWCMRFKRNHQARLLLREDMPGDRRPVVYPTCHGEAAFSAAQGWGQRVLQLPDDMLPNAFVVLDAFPLTPDGKLDRKALPMPEGESLAMSSGEDFLARLED